MSANADLNVSTFGPDLPPEPPEPTRGRCACGLAGHYDPDAETWLCRRCQAATARLNHLTVADLAASSPARTRLTNPGALQGPG